MNYNTTFNYPHPHKSLVSREVARLWPADNCRLSRKYDGTFAMRTIEGCTVLGELVKPKSGGFFTWYDKELFSKYGSFFAAFDFVSLLDDDMTQVALHGRHSLLSNLFSRKAILEYHDSAPCILAETVTDIDEVFKAGGEGVVRNEWTASYGQITVCKVGEIYLCRVCSIGGTQSVGIEVIEASAGATKPQPCFVPLRGGKCDQVRVGSLIRVEGMGLTDAGKIRQPNPAREWLVQY